MGKRDDTVKLEIDSVYKKNSNGTYYFRYQINGRRKAVSLKTKKFDDVVEKGVESLLDFNYLGDLRYDREEIYQAG